MVHPLVYNQHRTVDLSKVADTVFGKDGNTVGTNHIRDTMVNLRVDMVRATGKYDAQTAGFFQIFEGFFPLFADVFFLPKLFCPGVFYSLANL